MRAGQTGPLISISYSAHTSWPLGAVAEPAGAAAPGVAGARVGRLEVPGAAAARHAAVEARALVEVLALQRRALDVAAAEPRAAISAAVEAPVPFEPASPRLVRVWIAPTATHQRLAS